MLCRDKAIVSVTFLALVYLMVGSSLGVVAAPPGLAINQLVTSGQTVTLQAPSGDMNRERTHIRLRPFFLHRDE